MDTIFDVKASSSNNANPYTSWTRLWGCNQNNAVDSPSHQAKAMAIRLCISKESLR